jgi:5-methylcytosine-specific restriction endonuclease McrA
MGHCTNHQVKTICFSPINFLAEDGEEAPATLREFCFRCGGRVGDWWVKKVDMVDI